MSYKVFYFAFGYIDKEKFSWIDFCVDQNGSLNVLFPRMYEVKQTVIIKITQKASSEQRININDFNSSLYQ